MLGCQEYARQGRPPTVPLPMQLSGSKAPSPPATPSTKYSSQTHPPGSLGAGTYQDCSCNSSGTWASTSKQSSSDNPRLSPCPARLPPPEALLSVSSVPRTNGPTTGHCLTAGTVPKGLPQGRGWGLLPSRADAGVSALGSARCPHRTRASPQRVQHVGGAMRTPRSPPGTTGHK